MHTYSDSKELTCIEDRLNLLMTERSLIQNQFQLYARSTNGARTFLQKQVTGCGLSAKRKGFRLAPPRPQPRAPHTGLEPLCAMEDRRTAVGA